jgi:hypothetical protein
MFLGDRPKPGLPTAIVFCGAMAAGVLGSGVADAQTAATPSEQDAQENVASQIRADATAERESRAWLWWPVLAIDVPSVLAVDLGFATGLNPEGVSGAGVGAIVGGSIAYTFGAPVFHWIEGGVWQGFASLGLHLAGFAGGSATDTLLTATYCSSSGRGYGCSTTTSVPGLLVSSVILAVPTALDALFLSKTRVKHEWPAKTAWSPTLQLRQGGAVLGLGAAF